MAIGVSVSACLLIVLLQALLLYYITVERHAVYINIIRIIYIAFDVMFIFNGWCNALPQYLATERARYA